MSSVEDSKTKINEIENPLYNNYEYQSLYPPNKIFEETFKLYLEHQACYWSVNENNPSDDADTFNRLPSEFRDIVLRCIGCLMIGDSIVLDNICNNMLDRITSVEVKAFMYDQEAREQIHKIMYSKMLDVCGFEADYYRSEEFCNYYMSDFVDDAQIYSFNTNIKLQFFYIMMCENILFAPMFQTICYLAKLGGAPKLCDSNLLVMRDEFIHYKHARLQVRNCIDTKYDRELMIELLKRMQASVERLIHKIIGDYDDGVYNVDHVLEHFHHICHTFRMDNSLYESEHMASVCSQKYSNSPASKYMKLLNAESKINLMERKSTNYMVGGNDENINMDF